MIKSYATAIAVTFLFAGCSGSINKGKDIELPVATEFTCENGKKITVIYYFVEENIHRSQIQFEGAKYNLESVPSASGAKYSDGKHTWWTKGTSGFFEVDGILTLKNCSSQRKG